MAFLEYDVKVAVLIAVFYTFYRLLLAKDSFHRLNRVVLLLTAILAVPGLRQLMGLGGAGPPALVAGTILLVLCVAWLELLRLVMARLAARTASAL